MLECPFEGAGGDVGVLEDGKEGLLEMVFVAREGTLGWEGIISLLFGDGAIGYWCGERGGRWLCIFIVVIVFGRGLVIISIGVVILVHIHPLVLLCPPKRPC